MKLKDIALSAAYVGQMVVKAICVGAQEVWSAFKYIVFADPVVEQICATNFGNGKGLTEEQAAKVTSIGTVFKGNTEIISFEELELFENVTTLPRAFDGCSNLTNIKLPAHLKTTGDYLFYNCVKLLSIQLPAGLTEISQRTFAVCSALESVNIPSSVNKIGETAFYNNTKLVVNIEDIDKWFKIETIGGFAPLRDVKMAIIGNGEMLDYTIPEDVGSISNYKLRSVNNIERLDTNNVETLDSYALSNNTNLKSVRLRNVKTIGSSAFYLCSSLTEINIDTATSLADRVFNGCSSLACPIVFSPELTEIKEYTFRTCVKIPYFDFRRNTQVPTLSSTTAFDAPKKIVVPDALYDEWIAATNWVSFASKIVKASEFVEP